MHRIFISYHHRLDQAYKDGLSKMGSEHRIFEDMSVDTGDIPDDWSNETIRTTIRDEFLRDSTVTILLVGSETRYRKHIDWELYSSMINGPVNKRSGVIVIMLPATSGTSYHAAFANEKSAIYSDCSTWRSVESRSEYERMYPDMPPRIIDNLEKQEASVSVTRWDRIWNRPQNLALLIENAHNSRFSNEYCLKREMRRNDRNALSA